MVNALAGCQEFLARLRAFAGRLDAAQLLLATTQPRH
jgi:hypothetical protein